MTRTALVAAVLLLTASAEAPSSPRPIGIEECWMFDENNVPVGQRYDFFMRCCQRLRYGKSECFLLWVGRKPRDVAVDGSPLGRSQKVTSARLPIGGVWSLGRGRASMRASSVALPSAEHPGVPRWEVDGK